MQNGANEGNMTDRLIPITVRFTEGAMSVIDELADGNSLSKAEIVRLAVDNRLSQYLSDVQFIEHEDAVKYREELTKIFDELQSIRTELNRIGINFNQELKLKQIEKKYNSSNPRIALGYTSLTLKQNEIDSVKENTNLLNKSELDALMKKYESATRRVCDVVCRTHE